MSLLGEDAFGWSAEALLRRITAEAFRPFDLEQGPVFRAALFTGGPGGDHLVLSVHHIAADLWSLTVLLRELGELYRGGALPAVRLQAGDHALWQERMLASPRGELLWSYWRGRLAGMPPLDLSTDRPRPPVQGFHGASRLRRVPAADLHALARAGGSTSFMALLAAFSVLLARYSGQDDFPVGVPTSGRAAEGLGSRLAEAVGYLVNPVVLRADLAGEPTGGELLQRTRRTVLDAFAHQDLPFGLLAERLQPTRDASRPGLLQAMLAFENAPAPGLEALAALALGQGGGRLSLAKLELDLVALDAPGSQLDLELVATESAGELLLALRFDSDLFDAATADRMLGHLASLLGELAANPAAQVHDLPWQSEAERAQLLAEWNDTALAYPREHCFHELFAEQAERTPEAVAAAEEGLHVTYRELARRAGALARRLAGLGVGPEVVTPLAVDRGVGFLTGMLAVFEAGGAYLPLDPAYPKHRLAEVIGRSRAVLVLAEERHRPAVGAALDDLPGLTKPRLLGLEAPALAGGVGRAVSNNLAYVIFTSGSTGVPKGAMVEHRGMLNHLFAKVEDLGLTAADVVAQTASTSFDISVWQLLAALLAGGRTEVLGDDVARDPGLLLDALEQRRVSIFETVPSMLAALLDEIERRGRRPALSALRWLLATGEALPAELCRRWLSLYPGVPLLNAYGPTECSDDVTHWPVRRPWTAGSAVPIGRPVANTRIRLLDRGLRRVPVGAAGELCIGGDGVGRGYLGEPGRTAEVFVPDALAPAPGERLYRTGDLARQRPDGTLEFLGRIDHQVKVRGFRIELGEIETALSGLPAIQEVAAIVREDAGGQRLVAYFTAPVDPPAARELRDFLARRLPESMVPAAFVRLTVFPLTPNGKLDRKALPPPGDAEAAGEGFAAPSSPYEELLAGIWRQVLGIERVGIHESFFELGGHSLLATQVVSRVRGTLGVELPLRTLFERPTIAGLAGAVAELRAQRAGRTAPPISPVPRTGELPLSFAQERLWFLDQLQPGSAAYNIPSALGLRGRLSRPALAASLGRIVARHESLRTTFAAVEGRAVQTIQPPPDLAQGFALPLIDLRGLPAERRDAEAARRIREEVRQPFDLACGPLLRAALLGLEEDHHVAHVTLHHIVSDGWSTGVLVRELSAAYAALSAGREPSLPELPVQYADFAVWQRQWLSGEILDEQLAWWRDHLAGAPALLDLPLDRPRPPLQSWRGGHLTTRIPAGLSRDLEALAREQGATLFMLLLAAFQSLLFRWSGQQDVVVGSPVANRNRQETEGLIGFFANTLALRGDIGETSFTDLLRRTREVTLGAYAHQDLPFEKLVDELQPDRSLAHSPVFQVMLVLQNAPAGDLVLPGLTLEPVAAPPASAKFDLTLVVTETAQGLEAGWERAADLLDATTVARMAGHFLTLLAGVMADPERLISELPLLTESERAQLAEWNQTEEDLPQVCLHRLFEAQTGRTPDAVAAVCGGERWTYRELDGRANRLTRRLVDLGVGPEVPVGLCLERSLDLLAAILAVLKAGGAYVPLDPDYPAERLKLMLEDSGARRVITREALVDRMSVPGVLPLALDRDEAPLSPESAEVPRVASEPRHLAYLIYTSGSTGRPKGVGIEHRSASVLVHWAQREFADPEIAGVLAATSICFDLSVFEIFVPLSRGGKVILAQNALELPDLPAAAEVTLVNTVPSVIGALARQRGIPPSVRTVCLAGEPLRRGLVQEVYASSAASRVLNLYGPSEDTTYSTWTAVDRESDEEPAIGRPIAGTRVQILDASLRPMPVGAPGELCLAGAGLARGYLGRPDLTGEKFVPDPESELRGEPGGRLYRTGDLARWRPGGTLQFLGRRDGQVKVRGFRIELEEIEATLRDHPDVHEAAVLARGEGANRSLVAYVSPAHLSPATLRAFLGRRLPEPMVPTSWVTLPALPLSPNGKIDRRALPEPEPPRRTGEEDRPRTAVERRLAAIWAEVLRLDRIGVHDNFFALGGDSILSIQVVGRAACAGLRITPRQMFRYQTIAELAAVAEATAGAAAETMGVQGPVTGPVRLTPAQLWFLRGRPLDPHHFNQAVLLTPREPLSPAVVEQALAALVTHHDALRLRLADDEGGWQAWNESPGGPLPWTRLDLSGLPLELGWTAWEGAAAQVQASLDLSAGPLLRGTWIDLAEGRERLLLVVHHLAVDGVSWRILLEDLESACRQLRSGEAVSLPPKTTSFAEWARRFEEQARDVDLESELPWWRHEAEAPSSNLPLDHPNGESTEASAGRVSVLLDPDETRALLQEAPAAYRTQINDILLTALARALAGPNGALLVQMEGHGREDLFDGVDLSRTVGWFTSLFPLRLEAGPEEDPVTALKRIKEHLRAIPRRGLGYGMLRWLRGDVAEARELRSLARPEVTFNYLGQLDAVASASSLFAPAGELTGPARSPRERRMDLLTVDSFVACGSLRVDWTFSTGLHEPSTVERWAAAFLSRLRELIACCREAAVRRTAGYTPSDFPLAGIGQRELDLLLGTEWGIEDVYPLSAVQEGMLFHSLFEPGSGAYVEQLLARLEDELDAAVLESVCRRLVERHPILRTSFHSRDAGRPLQVVHGEAEVALEREDWSGLSPKEVERRLEDLLRDDREHGFDPARAPLMRWRLLRTGAREHRLLWTYHHLLLDGWSFAALGAELIELYAALRQGAEPELPYRRPFRDYIAWLERQDLARAEEHWRRTLAGWSEPTPLGIGGRTGKQGWELRQAGLTAAETATLQARARRSRVTLNTLLQAAWGLLLSRYSGCDDVVFGATVAGRPAELPGAESMLGLFINTLPVRLRVGDGELGTWLERLQTAQAELRQFEHSPLLKVQTWSEVPRGKPLFDSILVFENYPREASLQPGGDSPLGVAEVRALEQTNYPLTVVAVPGEALQLGVSFDRSRFETVTVARLLVHLGRLLLALAEAPDGRRLAELHVLSTAERHQVVLEWNDTAAAVAGGEGCVHELFAAQAERTPDAVAVIGGGEELTYRELDHRANRLARALQRRGVSRGDRVALCLERSPELVVAVLGILQTGAAYVPIDPTYPPERLASLLEDCAARALLSVEHPDAQLPRGAWTVLRLDADAAEIAREQATSSRGGTSPEDLAYVIYTSGSTGRPKGVMVPHGSLASYLAWARETYPEHGTGTLLHSSISFDLTVTSLFVPLISGQRVVLVPESEGITALGEALRGCSDLSFLKLTPSHARLLCHQLGAGELAGRSRGLIVGGEALTADHLAQWRESSPETIVYNEYGPTEATVGCAVYALRAGELAGGAVPVGRPIRDARLYLLDRRCEPVPVGATGELWIGGAGLARGYLGRPDLTAERFLPDPFGRAVGGRLYRTGDLARWRPDGNLDFLGRTDHQVKVRGFRIELGEIEASLVACPGVREAVVLALETAPGERRLVAYVVPRGEGLEEAELREALRRKLPEPMVPATFVFLESLPLGPHGKVDRQALSALGTPSRADTDAAGAAPRTAAEARLAAIWTEVLRLDRVGVHDNFFALGGDSIVSLQVVARAARFGLRITPRQIFEHQTIAALAGLAEVGESAAGEQGPVAGPVPLTPIQRWFFAQERPEPQHFNQAVLLEVRAGVDPRLVQRALGALVEHHDALRLRFAPEAGSAGAVWRQWNEALGETPSVPVVDLSGLAAGVIGSALEAAAGRVQASLDLTRGPLLRAAWFELGSGEKRLLLVIHHLAVDGVSWRVLLEDLEAVCRQLVRGEAPALPAKTTSFRSWAVRLAAYARTLKPEAELSWWLEQAKRPTVRLAVDYPGGFEPRGAGAPHEGGAGCGGDAVVAAGRAGRLPGAGGRGAADGSGADADGTGRSALGRPGGARTGGGAGRGGSVADRGMVHQPLSGAVGGGAGGISRPGVAGGAGAVAVGAGQGPDLRPAARLGGRGGEAGGAAAARGAVQLSWTVGRGVPRRIALRAGRGRGRAGT